MAKLRVHSMAVSLDGFAAGPDQSLETPLGVHGQELHGFVTTLTAFGGLGARRAPHGRRVQSLEAAEVASSPETGVAYVRLVRR